MIHSLTAHGPAWWSRPRHVGVSLALSSVHNGTTEDGLQLFGVWWGDGVAANCQLYQGQAHAPHVRLNRVVSALQSLRLLRNTQLRQRDQVEPRCHGKGEGWAKGWGEKAPKGEGRGGGGVTAKGWVVSLAERKETILDGRESMLR